MFAIITRGQRWHDTDGTDAWSQQEVIIVAVRVALTGLHVEIAHVVN